MIQLTQPVCRNITSRAVKDVRGRVVSQLFRGISGGPRGCVPNGAKRARHRDLHPRIHVAPRPTDGRRNCGWRRSLVRSGDSRAIGKDDMLHPRGVLKPCRMAAPIVIAANWAAAGAGLSLALLGDIVVAARSATFTTGHTAAGLTPDGGSTYLLPRRLGYRRAQEMVLCGRWVWRRRGATVGSGHALRART
jgi:hypothetical protein